MVKIHLPTKEMQEIWVRFLGLGDPLEEGMATHSSILAGKSYGQRSLASYNPWGCRESDMTEHSHACVLFLQNTFLSVYQVSLICALPSFFLGGGGNHQSLCLKYCFASIISLPFLGLNCMHIRTLNLFHFCIISLFSLQL